MRTLGFLAILYGFVAFFSVVFAQNINSWQPLQPAGKANAVSRFAGCPVYSYGWPAGDGCAEEESDIAAQWVFDQTSGSIFDRISSRELAVYKGASATVTYETENSDYSSGVNPGIDTYAQSAGHTTGYYATVDASAIAIGTGSAVIEWVASYDSSQADVRAAILWTGDTGAGLGLYISYGDLAGSPTVNVWVRAADATIVQNIKTLTFDPFDGVTRKHRVVIDRAGGSQYFINAVSQGVPASLATLIGRSVPSPRFTVGGVSSGAIPTPVAYPMSGVFYEFRLSHNATNLSLGPGD